MSHPDDKFHKVTKTTSEEKTTSSESIETRDSAAGRFEKRIVESETLERRTKHLEIIESGAIRIEHESVSVEVPATEPPANAAGVASPSTPLNAPSQPAVATGPAPDWSSLVPRRLKFMLRGCTAADPASGAQSAADLDGDFILDLALRDDRGCIWELTFPAVAEFYKVRASCRPGGGRFRWTAELDGLDAGPAWEVTGDAVLPVKLARKSQAPHAGIQWPDAVELVELIDVSSRSRPAELLNFAAASLAEAGSSGSSGEGGPTPPEEPPCEEADPECCKSDQDSTNPVRYFDGQIRLESTDLQSSGFGAVWQHTRVYSNQLSANGDVGQGFNWLVQQWPYLVAGAGGAVTVVRGTQGSLWFNRVGATYVGEFGALSTFEHDMVNHLFRLNLPGGTTIEFQDFDQLDAPAGLFSRQIAPGGAVTAVEDYTPAGLIGEVRRTGVVGGETLTEAFVYDYTINLQLESVRLRRQLGTGGWEDVRRAAYEYYDGSTSFGSAGDLQRVRLQVPTETDWADTQISYYRYYLAGAPHGFAHGLKYLVKPATYNKMVAASIDPLTATNAVLSTYADNYFEYDDQDRVTLEQVDGGSRTFTFAFTPGAVSTDFNVWAMKTVETLPDGNQNLVYTNQIGQFLVKELRAGTDRWIDAYHYNAQGREVWRAHPSAVLGYNDTTPDLNIALRSNAGLIEITEYYSTSGSGAAAGYVSARKLKEGSSGTPVVLETLTYSTQTAGGTTVYPVASRTVYRNDNGTGAITTAFDYTYYSGTTQVQQQTTTLPVIPTEQNGSGIAATRKKYYDEYGRTTWSMDERGYITHYDYDLATGAQILQIDDVDTSIVSGAPSNWTTPGDGGLNLITNSISDDQGRIVQTLGPAHEIDLNGTATTIRRASWRVYDDENHVAYSGQGYASGSTPDYDYTLINPVAFTQRDANGKVLEQIQAVTASTSGTLAENIETAGSGAVAFPQSSYTRWTTYQYTDCCLAASQRVYHTIPVSGAGSSGTNYDETDYGYDVMKRRSRTVTPGGTITDLVFDPRGLVIGTYVGTNDDGANEQDPTGGGLDLDNNMVVITENEYDDREAGGDGNVTMQKQYVNASDTRVTTFSYDFRSRQIWIDGEIDFYQQTYYDNLNRVVRIDQRDTSAEGNLIGRNETQYDNQGRVFRKIRYGVDPTTGTVGNSLIDNTWYNASGRVTKKQPSGSQSFIKLLYDSLGRAISRYNTYDLGETSYGESASADDDVILEQSETLYDAGSNAIQTTQRQRYHNAPNNQTGPLQDPSANPKARVTYMAIWHDALGRRQASVNYGTNGGTALSRPDTSPVRSDDVLITSTVYDSAANVLETTDPSGMVTRFAYDAVGRQISQIANYLNSIPDILSDDEDCAPSADTNVTVITTYNPDGNICDLTAVNASTGDQITKYVYGTTLDDSEVASTLLKRTEIYPDSEDEDDVIRLSYSRQQQVIQITDQGGTIHRLDYDLLGRQTQDRVTVVGTNVDNTVLRIESTYEVRGLKEHTTSYDDATVGTGAVVNDCQYLYNDFGQLITEYQSHDGAVDTDITPKVQYAYADGSANTIRQEQLIYPNGRELTYDYGVADGADDAISRIIGLIDDDGTTHLADYSYLGMNKFVVTDYTEPQTKYTLIGTSGGNDPDTGDIYRGLDRFGRIKDSYWYNYGNDSDTDRIKYGYDRVGNRLWRENVVAQTAGKAFDELYQYDQIHRLKHMDRGTLNSANTAMTTKTFEQCWTLDETGNCGGFREDDTGDGDWDIIQSRAANRVNEITDISESAGPTWVVPAYSSIGNMATIPQPADPTTSYSATYDAWNRSTMLLDQYTSKVLSKYQYDGAHRRIVQVTFSSGIPDAIRHFYYNDSSRWQMIEERLGDSPDGTSAERQFVWGSRYVDDCVLRDRDTNNDGVLDERLYSLQDANWNVTSLIDGAVLQRMVYSAYGTPIFLSSDFDLRGDAFTWEILYAGYQYDPRAGLYHVRHRIFHSILGIWLQRDPLGTLILLVNMNEYIDPLNLTDPMGLQAGISSPLDCPLGTVFGPKPGFIPTTNGCSTPDFVVRLMGWGTANCPRGAADFTDVCNTHDVCYASCGISKASCDDDFLDDLELMCTVANNVHSAQCPGFNLSDCLEVAQTMRNGLNNSLSDTAFEMTQNDSCECICENPLA